MRFSQYAALNGACSTFIGVLFIVSGFPGLFKDTTGGYWWVAVPSVLVVLVPLALVARSRGIPVGSPGRWLTDRSIGRAQAGLSVLPAPALRRRLLIETVNLGRDRARRDRGILDIAAVRIRDRLGVARLRAARTLRERTADPRNRIRTGHAVPGPPAPRVRHPDVTTP